MKRNQILSILYTLAAVCLTAGTSWAGSLKISWDPVTDSRVVGYRLKFGTASRTYSQSVNTGNVSTYTLQNLTEGTTYYAVVVALDANSNESVPSAEVSAQVLAITASSSLSQNATTAGITWRTNKPSDGQVEYGTSSAYGQTSPLDSSLLTDHSATLTGLLPATTYHYRVRSRDEGGSSAVSSDATFTTPDEVLISSLSPSSGSPGTDVVISGRGFGSGQAAGEVTFSGVTAPVKAWGGSSITASVPSTARSGPVVVTVGNLESNSVTFKVNGKLAPPGRVRVKR
ncbi:MAG: fibronectin type III domain-containing protein [Acidobacteriota bacterium]